MDKSREERLKKLKESEGYKKNAEEYVKARKGKDTNKALKVDALMRAMEQDQLGPLKSDELEKLKDKKKPKKKSLLDLFS